MTPPSPAGHDLHRFVELERSWMKSYFTALGREGLGARWIDVAGLAAFVLGTGGPPVGSG